MIYNIPYDNSIIEDERDVARFIEESLREFPEQVPEEQPGPLSAEDHYNLGIAYKVMGLLNKAREHFRLAARGTERFLDASVMLARCCKE